MKKLLDYLPVVLGLLILGGGAYIGWILYQAARGQAVEVEIQEVQVDLNLADAALGMIFKQKLEIDPEVKATVEFTNTLPVGVRIYDVTGVLSVSGTEMDYTITGLENGVRLEPGQSHQIEISLDPENAEVLVLGPKVILLGVVKIEFVGVARVSVLGQEQEAPVLVEKVVEVPIF
jgi:hypothetical protein